MKLMYAVGGSLSTWGREELRYSIRSACMYLPIEEVWVVGDVPAWFAGTGITMPDHEHHQKSIASKVLRALNEGLSGEFIHCNDDFFFLGFDARMRYAGLLSAHVKRMEASRRPDNWFLRSQRDVLNACREMGIEEPLNFATHTPVLMTAEGARAAAELAMSLPIGGDMFTLYWAVSEVEIVRGRDAKSVPYGSDIYYSSAPRVEETHEFRDWLQQQFPTPSPYER